MKKFLLTLLCILFFPIALVIYVVYLLAKDA